MSGNEGATDAAPAPAPVIARYVPDKGHARDCREAEFGPAAHRPVPRRVAGPEPARGTSHGAHACSPRGGNPDSSTPVDARARGRRRRSRAPLVTAART